MIGKNIVTAHFIDTDAQFYIVHSKDTAQTKTSFFDFKPTSQFPNRVSGFEFNFDLSDTKETFGGNTDFIINQFTNYFLS